MFIITTTYGSREILANHGEPNPLSYTGNVWYQVNQTLQLCLPCSAELGYSLSLPNKASKGECEWGHVRLTSARAQFRESIVLLILKSKRILLHGIMSRLIEK
uniref:Uncharacterized protein n=1 Tax=Arundo donax TaxID=35708 RepID=A0A0A9GZY8_ARUDO